MPNFILPIFPAQGLASSVITTVWIGVWVSCFFNLRLGWVLSGIVVPGYVVPLLLIRPWTVVIIFLEAMVTYGCVWFYSSYLAGKGHWTDFFGRDRFFALLVVSVLVRLSFDNVLLPAVGEYINGKLAINFDYSHNLQSYGLIVVALIANMFWKPGLRRGFIPVTLIILFTYLIVRYGLMLFTNFNVGSLAYMYEDLAASMLASPKAYIILLTTAAIASRMNRYYGWEFNGILIPGLIALQWFRPWKLLMTFGETLLVIAVATLILRLPFFQRTTIEGARKLLLFFNISFFLKLTMGHLWLVWFPAYKVSDFYGFGYLLTTLLALKMHDKEIPVIMTRAILQTSLVSVAWASIIGFSLTLLPGSTFLQLHPEDETVVTAPVKSTPVSVIDFIRNQKVRLYSGIRHNGYTPPNPTEQETFADAFRTLSRYHSTSDPLILKQAHRLLHRINYDTLLIDNRYLCIFEQKPRRGWGFFILNLQSDNHLLLEVPAPMNEWGVMEAGANIFTGTNARALAIGGTDRFVNDNGVADVLTTPRTPLALFHREFGRKNTLQLRGYSKTTRQVLNRTTMVKLHNDDLPSSLWIKKTLPPDVDLSWLRQYTDSLDIHWANTPLTNRLRDVSSEGFAELNLTRTDCRKLLFLPFFPAANLLLMQKDQSIIGYLQDWLLSDKERIAAKNSNQYIPPRLEELLFFDKEVVTPLLQLIRERIPADTWSDDEVATLTEIGQAAGIMGYELIRYRHKGSDSTYLILAENDQTLKKRYWGFYVFRTSAATPFLVQIPRPIADINVFEYGVALFERLNAQFLIVGGTHPKANADDTSDLLLIKNKANLFNLVSQAAIREWGADPMLLVQCRAQDFGEEPHENAVLAWFRKGTTNSKALDEQSRQLLSTVKNDLGTVKYVGETSQAAGYSGGATAASLYLEQSLNKDMVILWLSPLARLQFRQQTENRMFGRQMLALGITTYNADLYTFLEAGQTTPVSALPSGLEHDLLAYLRTRDIVALRKVLQIYPDCRFIQLLDISSKQTFLLVSPPKSSPALIVNFFPRDPDSTVIAPATSLTRQQVTNFVESRAAWLKLGENR